MSNEEGEITKNGKYIIYIKKYRRKRKQAKA